MLRISITNRIVITNEEEAIKLTKELNRLIEVTPDLYFISTFLQTLERISRIQSALKDWEYQKRILAKD
jgi:hypothetical protein